MAEEEATDQGAAEEPQGPEEGTDWKAMVRKWERQAKANKDKADAYDRLQEDAKTDLQKATERAERAERELKGVKAAQELSATRAKVSKETGVPAELIQGADEDGMRASAKALLSWARPTAPRAPRPGSFSDGAGSPDARRELARKLFGEDKQQENDKLGAEMRAHHKAPLQAYIHLFRPPKRRFVVSTQPKARPQRHGNMALGSPTQQSTSRRA